MFQELPHIYVEPHELKKAIQCTGTFDFLLQSNSFKYLEQTSMKNFHGNYLMIIIESSRPVSTASLSLEAVEYVCHASYFKTAESNAINS